MKGGAVMHLRLNPQDVMGVIDLVDHLGLYQPGLSLPQATVWALRYQLEAARKVGIIPNRDGFEYSHMISRFTGIKQGRKLAVTEGLEDVAKILERVPANPQSKQSPTDVAFDKLARERGELSFREAADPLNFTEEDKARLAEISRLLDDGGQI